VLNGTKDPYIIAEAKRQNHIPSTAPYTLEECVFDLLDMAAQLLVSGGRLVFYFPAPREESFGEHFPTHPCFTLIAKSEQILSTRYSRCLLTMEKTGKYTEEIAASARDTHHQFKINHAEIVEKDRENRLHNLVFAPLDTTLDGSAIGALDLSDPRPRYRGKYV
jgi:tRNA (guanine10-N2)-methyltransferase